MIIGTVSRSPSVSMRWRGTALTRAAPVARAWAERAAAACGSRVTSASMKRSRRPRAWLARWAQAWFLPVQPSGRSGTGARRRRGSPRPVTIAAVSSVEWSSPTITSTGTPVLASAARTVPAMLPASLRAGIRIETRSSPGSGSGLLRTRRFATASPAGRRAASRQSRARTVSMASLRGWGCDGRGRRAGRAAGRLRAATGRRGRRRPSARPAAAGSGRGRGSSRRRRGGRGCR